MNSIEKNLLELDRLQNLQQRSHWMNMLHPLGKLLLSIFYLFIVMSVGKYDLTRAIVLSIYPIFGFVVGELSFREGLYRMRLVLPLVLVVGIFNPFFDKEVFFYIFAKAPDQMRIPITGGILSMITLMLKGLYAVLSAYILIATTSIEDICYALRSLRMPRILVIVIMLIYRYFGIMAREADRITTAYRLRAPSQKGIHYKAWGTLVGQWLLRSMDKANAVYESMLLRGFKGDFEYRKRDVRPADLLYPAIWMLLLVAVRLFIKL